MSFDENFEGYEGIKMRNAREGNTMTAREINPRPQPNSIAEASQRMGPRPSAPLENPDMECFERAVLRQYSSNDREELMKLLAHAYHDEYVTIGSEEFYRRHPGWKEFGVPYRADRFEVAEEMIPVQNPGKPPAKYMDEMVPKYAKSFKKKCRGMTIGDLKKFAKKHKHTADELRGKNKTQVYNLMAQRFAAWKWHQKPLAERTKISTVAEGSAWSEDYDQPIWLAIRKWAKEKGVKDRAMITKLGKVNTVSKLKKGRDVFANTLKNKYEREGWPKAKDYGTAIRTVIARLKGKPVSKKKMRNPDWEKGTDLEQLEYRKGKRQEEQEDQEDPDAQYKKLGLFGYIEMMADDNPGPEAKVAWDQLGIACAFGTLFWRDKAFGKSNKETYLGRGGYELSKLDAGRLIHEMVLAALEKIAEHSLLPVETQLFYDDIGKILREAGRKGQMSDEGFWIVEQPFDIWDTDNGFIQDAKLRKKAWRVFPLIGM